MFALGALPCVILGALEDAFDWAAGKIRRQDSAATTAREKES